MMKAFVLLCLLICIFPLFSLSFRVFGIIFVLFFSVSSWSSLFIIFFSVPFLCRYFLLPMVISFRALSRFFFYFAHIK